MTADELLEEMARGSCFGLNWDALGEKVKQNERDAVVAALRVFVERTGLDTMPQDDVARAIYTMTEATQILLTLTDMEKGDE